MKSGFTLLELLLSITVMAVIGGVGVPIYASLQTRSDLSTAAQLITQSARRAQTRAWANEQDTNWGVYVTTGQTIIYKGNSYAARDTAWDETYPISTSLVITGDNEYLFSKTTGVVDAGGTITITSLDSSVANVTIGANGQVF